MSRTAPKSRLKCGDFGGRNAAGNPCGVASVDGPCRRHAEQVEAAEAHHLIPGTEFIVPPFQRTRNKVAICGFTAHRVEALELGDDFEIWGLNELYRYMPVARFHRWFEIHDREYLEADDDGKKHMQDLGSLSIPIFMQTTHEDIPAAVRFPIDELIEQLGSGYFTNCPAYMIAMAIAMGFEEIHVYGVDMAQDTEYAVQRPCCEYWLGRAIGAGIKVHVPEMSDLLSCVGRYGYNDDGSKFGRKLQERLSWLHEQDNQRLAMLRKLEAEKVDKFGKLTLALNRIEGAILEMRQQEKDTGESEFVTKRLGELDTEYKDRTAKKTKLEEEYQTKHHGLRDERNQIVGGIQNMEYMMRAWVVKPESAGGGGNIPTAETRSLDPALGIQAPSGDNSPAEVPEPVLG